MLGGVTQLPVLVLPPRYSEDTVALWRAALARGWRTERLSGWRAPAPDWLTYLPTRYLRRAVGFSTLGAARTREGPWPWFVKPASGEKPFEPRAD